MKWSICLFLLFLLIAPLGVSIFAQEDIDHNEQADKISLDLKNVEIVELLRILSLKTQKTIVPSKNISGRVTIYLNNVSFNDVLDIVLLTQGLALNKKGNIYYVMSEAEFKKIFGRDYIDNRKVETVKLVYAKPSVVFNALGQLKSDLGKLVVDESSGTIILIDIPEKLQLMKNMINEMDQPLTTKVYNLNYIKAADAKTQITSAITQGTGEVIVDERSSKAIVSDLAKKIDKIGMLVREIDEESRQVYVEADIVELSLSDKFERGIDWEKVYTSAAMDGLTFAGYFPATLAQFQKISVGTLAVDHYKAILNFLNTYGKTNIISQPRIAVVNNEEANIMIGVREAYITQTQSQATSTTVTSETVEFIDVGVKLKISPRIGSDGFITMKLKPEVSSVKETVETALGSRIPIVQTSESETTVKVKDGTMIMIAGMTKIENTDAIRGWPVLSKIPFLDIFFGNRTSEKKRTEVIVFLTPRIMRSDEGLRGLEIAKILPKEYLPKKLQVKIDRDQKIDSALFETEENPQGYLKDARGIDAAERAGESTPLAVPLQSARDYYFKGLESQASLDNKEAIRYFKKAIELDSKYAAAYNNLGIAYEKEFMPEKAEEAYLRAISVDPYFAPAYSNLALLNEDRLDYTRALIYWRKRVLYGDPNDEWTKQAIQRVKELSR
ncbi:MAG: secretin N-terminal domain-containing protein [Candidatus Omnitrophota bacterium]